MDTAPRPAGYLCWAVSRTRLRSSGSPARPNICLLIILMWLDPAFDRDGAVGHGEPGVDVGAFEPLGAGISPFWIAERSAMVCRVRGVSP
jgi:hypothetical protein